MQTTEKSKLPDGLARFWNDVCDQDIKFALEICTQYEDYIAAQLDQLEALVNNATNTKLNQQNIQLTEEILHKLTGSLALLGFDPQSHYLHELELKFSSKTTFLDQATFDNIQSQVRGVSTLIRQCL